MAARLFHAAVPHAAPRGRGVLPGALVAVITALVFSPSLRNGFTNWDDDAYVTANAAIREINADNLRKILTSSYGYYHPLPGLTFMLEYALFGMKPAGYHATNVLLHCICAVIVFAFLSALSGSHAAGFLAALLFAVHPLRVESVAWITERKGLLSYLFYLLSLLAYVRYAQEGRVRSYCACVCFFAISLLSKPMAVSLPFVLLCVDWFLHKRIGVRRLLEKAPFLAIAAAWIAVSYFTQESVGALAQSPPLLVRLCLPFYGILFYVVTTAVPLHLSALYPMPLAPAPAVKVQLVLSLPLVIGLGWAVWRSRRLTRKILFGSLFFLFTVLPVLQLVPVGSFAVADRYSYLAAVGIAFILAEGVIYLYREKIRHREAARSALLAGLALLLFSWSLMAVKRCGVWNNSITLWSDALRHYPSAIAYNNRGTAYAETGQAGKAIADFTQSIRCDPAFAKAYNNRGIAFVTMGNADRALADFSKTVLLDTGNFEAFSNRGIMYVYKREFDSAIADFSRALAIKPDYADAYANRGIAHRGKGLHALAVSDFDKAIALDPADTATAGKRKEALDALHAESMRPAAK